jgi:transposase
MKFITGKNRNQTFLFPISLEDSIESENSVRSINQFVDSLDLETLGFRLNFKENGPPAYHPYLLIKLYIYGYMNRIRSSLQLEKECKRNIEVMW